MMVSTSIWKEGAQIYLPLIHSIVIAFNGKARDSQSISTDIWINICVNGHGLMERMGDADLTDDIVRYTTTYCLSHLSNINAA